MMSKWHKSRRSITITNAPSTVHTENSEHCKADEWLPKRPPAPLRSADLPSGRLTDGQVRLFISPIFPSSSQSLQHPHKTPLIHFPSKRSYFHHPSKKVENSLSYWLTSMDKHISTGSQLTISIIGVGNV